MYGLIDHLLAEEIIHLIGRKQAAEETRELLETKRLSLMARLVNRLPLWTTNQQHALNVQRDEASLNTAQCE